MYFYIKFNNITFNIIKNIYLLKFKFKLNNLLDIIVK